MPRATPARFAVVTHGGYGFPVLFAIGCTKEQIRPRLLKMGAACCEVDDMLEEIGPTYWGHTTIFKNGRSVVWLKGFSGSAEDWALLAHECFHAVALLFEQLGLELVNESQEAYGYAIQNLMGSAAVKLGLTKA